MWGKIKRWLRKSTPKPSPVRNRQRGEHKMPKVMHPLALFKEDMAMLKGKWPFNFGHGDYFILHFTAGRVERKARDFFKMFLDRGLCTYFIDGKGVIWQQFDGDTCGSHVGKNKWLGKDIGKRCAGVEVANSGKLEVKNGDYFTWYGEKINKNEVREITESQVLRNEYTTAGFFRKFKPQQEVAIAELMAWHIAKGLPKWNILGHDLVAYPRGRKNDHSGALSKPLDAFIEENVMPLVAKYEQGELNE